MKKPLIPLLLCSLLGIVHAQDKSAPTLFVAPLEGDTSQILGWQPALGEGLAEMLVTEVGRIGKFQVLESTALKDLAEEIKLGESGYVSGQERVEKGGWAGADFMLRGKVTRFGSKEQGVGLGGFASGSLGATGVKVTTCDVRIDWRLVDVYNRKIIKTGQATASQKGASFNVGVAVNGQGGAIGFSNHEFMNSALGKATAKAVTNIVQELALANVPESGRIRNRAQVQVKHEADTQAVSDALKDIPGKVLATPDKTTLIVSLGAKNGFKRGDKLKLYQSVDIKDDKGNVVFSEEKLAGEIILDQVQEDRSKATYTGDAEVKSGWVVKTK